MQVIGVTGGVGSGKSTVSRIFERLGAQVLDADRITHALMEPGSAVWKRIRWEFGPTILATDGRIDRRRLGEQVFRSRSRLKVLSGIVHPAVRREMKWDLRRIERQDPEAVVVLDIPLLLESRPVPRRKRSSGRIGLKGRWRRRVAGGSAGRSAYGLDALIVVSAPQPVIARRLKQRSGWSLQELRRRAGFQMPLREKERLADFVVDNGKSPVATRRQVVRIWKQIVKEKD